MCRVFCLTVLAILRLSMRFNFKAPVRLIFWLLSLLILVSCSGSGGGGSSSSQTVTGFDYSGTYYGNQIECWSPNLTVLHTTAVLASFPESITITGNTYRTLTNDNSCAVEYTGSIVFNTSGVSLTNRVVKSATGGSCTENVTLSNNPAHTVSPTSITATVTTNEHLADLNGIAYVRVTNGDIGILTTYTNTASPTDLCLMRYVKQ